MVTCGEPSNPLMVALPDMETSLFNVVVPVFVPVLLPILILVVEPDAPPVPMLIVLVLPDAVAAVP